MDMSGEQRIEARREQVWKALNNANVLRKCIPNCESMDKKSPTEWVATIKVKVAFISASFKTSITLTNIKPAESYTLVSDGSAALVGSLKSSTDVQLRDDGGATLLNYTIRAEIGGKFAMLGSKMIDSTAQKMAAKFFEKLNKIILEKNQAKAATEA
jgi:hypothetical protein